MGAVHIRLAPQDSHLKPFLEQMASQREGLSIWAEDLTGTFAVDSQIFEYVHYAEVEYEVNNGGVKTRHALEARRAREQLTGICNRILSGLEDLAAKIKPAIDEGQPVRVGSNEVFNCLTRYNTLNVAPNGGIYFRKPEDSDWEEYLPMLRKLAARKQGVAILYGGSKSGDYCLAATHSYDLASAKSTRP